MPPAPSELDALASTVYAASDERLRKELADIFAPIRTLFHTYRGHAISHHELKPRDTPVMVSLENMVEALQEGLAAAMTPLRRQEAAQEVVGAVKQIREGTAGALSAVVKEFQNDIFSIEDALKPIRRSQALQPVLDAVARVKSKLPTEPTPT